MKIGVIGLGVSGAIFAISRKRSHPKDEIIIFERLDTPLKKLLATGNGKCNIANTSNLKGIYNSEVALDILNKYDYETQNRFLDSLNIKTKKVGELVYPISESALTVKNALVKALNKAKINIKLNSKVSDYLVNDNSVDVFLENETISVDKLVISVGGKSSPNLGSDGSLFEILKEHNYKFKDVNPGLCPIYTIEKTKELSGVRVKAKLTLFKGNKNIHSEIGEVLFKDQGLSGIAIFNLSRIIAKDLTKKYTISIDLVPEISRDDLGIFLSFNSSDELLDAYLNPKLANFIRKEKLHGVELINRIKNMKFHFKELYDFEFSQVSIGGISLDNINDKLKSKIENNVYFTGEVLNVDAPCGGFNLMWAIASGLLVADYL